MTIRRLLALGAVVAFAFSLSTTDAFAGKKKKKDKGADETETAAAEEGDADESEGFEETGIKEFDDVFNRAKGIHMSLTEAETQINDARSGILTALGAAEGTPISDALAELQTKAEGKISVAMEGQLPSLSAEEGVPEDVTTALDGVNTAIGNLSGTITTLMGLPDEAQALVSEAQAMPGKINPNLLKDNGLKVTQLPSVTKKVGSNSKNVGTTPKKVDEVTEAATGLLGEVSGAFAGGGEEKAE